MSELLQSILPKNTPVFPVYGGSRFLRIFFYFHQTTRRHIQKTAFFMRQQVSKIFFLFPPDYTASHPKDSVLHEAAGF